LNTRSNHFCKKSNFSLNLSVESSKFHTVLGLNNVSPKDCATYFLLTETMLHGPGVKNFSKKEIEK
jgi:hypothetical protein